MTESKAAEEVSEAAGFTVHFTFELAGLLQWGAEPICEANGPEAYQAVITDAAKVTCEDCKRMLADPAPALAAIRKRADAAVPLPWSLERESCDCGDGYGCSHGSWPYCFRLPVPNTEREDGKTRDYDFSYTEISDFPMETAEFMVAARTHVPRLLAAVEAGLKHHQPVEITVWHACAAHEITRTVTDPHRFGKMRGCPDCKPETVTDCSKCDEPWPCKEHRDIASALTGPETADVT